MGNLKEALDNLESGSMKNISELAEIKVADVDLKEETRQDKDGNDYTVKYIEIGGEEYRVPYTVLAQLKDIMERKPNLESFSVSRKGTTKEDTRYTVIPL